MAKTAFFRAVGWVRGEKNSLFQLKTASCSFADATFFSMGRSDAEIGGDRGW